MNKFARIVRNNKGRALAVVLASAGPVFAQATGPDFSSLTGAVDFGTVVTAVIALAGLMMAPKVAGWGARKVLGFIRG